jgi:hypothetical protein
MIARAMHTVNAGLVPDRAELRAVEGVDLAGTVQRIVGWGGDEALYTHFLGRGLASAASSASTVQALAVLAGWRSGVVDLRDEVLRRVAELPAKAAEAALGLPAGQLDAFITGQASDPFAWPTADQLVARIGGFRGFGDAWVAAPTSAQCVSAGAVQVCCGDELWTAYVDVFGTRLARDNGAAREKSTPATGRALVSENSYLVEIVRGAA